MSAPTSPPPGLLIAAPRSGSGKTTLTLGLMRALRQRGLRVQAVKCGPDYIDPAFHAEATGRPGLNLDSWAMEPALLHALTGATAEATDLMLCEGLMGLFDGVPGEPGRSGSSADIAAAFGWPVVLILDVSGQSQSAAATALGCVAFDRRLTIAGVVLNRIGSVRHQMLATNAIEAIGLPVLGALRRAPEITLPERHLGLVQAAETAALDLMLDRLAGFIATQVDLDRLLTLAAPSRFESAASGPALQPPGQKIAIARDRRLLLSLSASSPRLARGRRGTPFLFAARRRSAARGLRFLLAAGRLSRTSCRPDRGGDALSPRPAAFRGEPAGPWRMRRLYGPRRRPHRCRRQAPSDGGPPRTCDHIRKAPPHARLS